VTEPVDRPTELEGVAMLALRLQLDSLSLRVDRGEMTLGDARSQVRYSANEVVRGSPPSRDDDQRRARRFVGEA